LNRVIVVPLSPGDRPSGNTGSGVGVVSTVLEKPPESPHAPPIPARAATAVTNT